MSNNTRRIGGNGESIDARRTGEAVNPATIDTSMLASALETTNWNITQAAKLLGLSRDALRYRMRKHNLHVHS